LKQFAAKSLQVYNEEKKYQQVLSSVITEEKLEKLKQTALREGKKKLGIFPIPQSANAPASNSNLRAKPRKFPGQRISVAQAAANAIGAATTPIPELLKYINNPNIMPSTNGTNGTTPVTETQKKKKKKKKKANTDTNTNTSNTSTPNNNTQG